ncbi:hypothetical protein [Flavobacterium sp. Root186]|uniref:hypothetical protein n=1 Tax=Flavobacterium sp. Root186 TaxID=1736485 RepID=UPI000ACA0AD8|nr:hypothetical protein [Flavobacterium sp. Root186]
METINNEGDGFSQNAWILAKANARSTFIPPAKAGGNSKNIKYLQIKIYKII